MAGYCQVLGCCPAKLLPWLSATHPYDLTAPTQGCHAPKKKLQRARSRPLMRRRHRPHRADIQIGGSHSLNLPARGANLDAKMADLTADLDTAYCFVPEASRPRNDDARPVDRLPRERPGGRGPAVEHSA